MPTSLTEAPHQVCGHSGKREKFSWIMTKTIADKTFPGEARTGAVMGGVLGGGAQGPSGQPLQQGLCDGTSMAPRHVLRLTWNSPCRMNRDAPDHTWSYRLRWEGPRALQGPGSPGGGEAAPEGGSTCTPTGLGLLPSQDQAGKVQADTHGRTACSPLARAHSNPQGRARRASPRQRPACSQCVQRKGSRGKKINKLI